MQTRSGRKLPGPPTNPLIDADAIRDRTYTQALQHLVDVQNVLACLRDEQLQNINRCALNLFATIGVELANRERARQQRVFKVPHCVEVTCGECQKFFHTFHVGRVIRCKQCRIRKVHALAQQGDTTSTRVDSSAPTVSKMSRESLLCEPKTPSLEDLPWAA